MELNYPNHIILDDIGTWPTQISNLLTEVESNIHKYRTRELEIDNAAKSNVLLRYQRPINEYNSYWSDAISRIKYFINESMIVGFHCSRLTNDEIASVRQNGLLPLAYEYTIRRIDIIKKAGLISPIVAQELIEKNESRAQNRNGNVCFFHALRTLKDDVGLYRLFRAWGGEAIYLNHENNQQVFQEIIKIGTPCIVVASLQPEEVGFFNDIAPRIINTWLDRNALTEYSQDCDTIVKREVSVLEIIDRDDPRFEELTDCTNWYYKI